MTNVDSRSLRSYDYSPVTKEMTVVFVNGQEYVYKNVPPELVEEMREAESKGSFHAKHIRGKYEYRRVQEQSDG